ncbi:MAG: hypothetical protein U0800_18145 [Isosphaeraceae bacterium]
MRTFASGGVVFGALCMAISATPARAQFMYPFGYGNMGWSQWGADPAAGYMAGLGSFAKGKGEYVLDQAKADQINQQTAERWNKALRARQRAIQQDLAEEEARKIAQYSEEARVAAIERGSTLNFTLDRILGADSLASKSAALRLPMSASVIRDIPFQSQTEAISLSINQATAREDNWPAALRDSRLTALRAQVRDAIEAALAEDVKGEVSDEAGERVEKAINALHDRFIAITSELDPGFNKAEDYLRTLAGLARMIHNPQFQKAVAQLENYKGGNIGDLIVFMHAFNLRFGPATTPRQRQIYRELAPILFQASDQVASAEARAAIAQEVDRSGQPFLSAADEAFKKLKWEQMGSQPKAEKP